MVAFQYRMPAGIPGDVVSMANAFIEPQEIQPTGSTGAPTEYGIPVVIDGTSFKVREVGASDTAAVVRGILVRPYPTNAGQDALAAATPATRGAADVLRAGKITVRLRGSTAAVKGGIVYVWKSATAGNNVQGRIVAADPSSDGFALPATFDGPADDNGFVTISYNI